MESLTRFGTSTTQNFKFLDYPNIDFKVIKNHLLEKLDNIWTLIFHKYEGQTHPANRYNPRAKLIMTYIKIAVRCQNIPNSFNLAIIEKLNQFPGIQLWLLRCHTDSYPELSLFFNQFCHLINFDAKIKDLGLFDKPGEENGGLGDVRGTEVLELEANWQQAINYGKNRDFSSFFLSALTRTCLKAESTSIEVFRSNFDKFSELVGLSKAQNMISLPSVYLLKIFQKLKNQTDQGSSEGVIAPVEELVDPVMLFDGLIMLKISNFLKKSNLRAEAKKGSLEGGEALADAPGSILAEIVTSDLEIVAKYFELMANPFMFNNARNRYEFHELCFYTYLMVYGYGVDQKNQISYLKKAM